MYINYTSGMVLKLKRSHLRVISLQLKPLTLSHYGHLQLSQHDPALEYLLEALLSVLYAP